MPGPKLLIFTPTYGKLLRPETVASVRAQEFAGTVDYKIGRHNPYPGADMRNVCAQYIRARQLFLEGDWDALLAVEHDMVLPPGAAQALYDTRVGGELAPVVYGVYLLRHGTRVLSAWQYKGDRNLGMTLSLYPDELRQAREKRCVRVSGVGFGCTLFRRAVVEQIPFRYPVDGSAPDIPFALDCLHRGVPAYARFDVPCGHIEGGITLHPYERDGGVVARCYILQDVNINVDGQTLHLTKGRYLTLPVSNATELARAGYVRITNKADEATETPGRETADAPPPAEQATATVTKRRKKAS